jgi:hypothetical protein
MFFRDDEDDIARRRAENEDKSMFFHSDEDDDDDEGSLFWNSKNKISYDELYGGETGRRIFENTAKRFEKIKNNNSNIKNENTDLWRANKVEKYYCIKLDVISYEDKIEDRIEENKASDVNNYNSGNYFKTLEIAKQVFNSDVWKNRFKKYRKDIKRVKNKAYFTINLDNFFSLYSVYGDFYQKYDNKNYNEGNYFNEFDEVIDFLKNHLENSQNEIKNFVKNITDEDFVLNENEYQDENIINEENYDKTYNKTYNNSYWRAEKDRVYFTIDCNFVKANNELYSSENYYTGNYFKTLEIAKQVLNSDIWKNRFWDYRKNKNIRRSDVYYTIDFLLGEPTISTELNVSFKSNFDFEEGNYFNTKREAIEFLKVHYHNSIKRIKDFTNNLMKEKGYAIRGYDLKKEISDDDKKFIEEIDKINNEMAETNKEEEKVNKKVVKLENKYKNLFKDNLYYLDENSFSNKLRLNKGETYYFLFEENIISVIENYDSIDNERFKIGNYFTTLEIANQVLNSDIYQNRYKGAKEKYTNNIKWRLNNQYYCLDFSNGNILREVNKGTNLDEKRHKLGNFFGSYEEAKEVKETLWSETWKSIRDMINKNLGYGYKQENLVEAIQVTKENISDIIKMLEINNEKSFNYIVNWNDELEEIWYKENPYSNQDVIIVKANSYIVKFSEIGNKHKFEFYTEEEFKRKFKKIQ